MLTELRQNQNSNGGGLASNITGRFESNRHAIARIEKFTFGEVSAHLKKKKNGGLIIIQSQMNKLKNEILRDSISWREIPSSDPERILFDFFDAVKHTEGYGMIKLTILNDGNNVFVTSDLTSGYFKTYAELKTNQRLEVGSVHTKRSFGNTLYIKIY